MNEEYNIIWDNPSEDVGGCMPFGGFDVGCNVWVEKETIFFYAAQSGAFDTENRMCKAGRIGIHITPYPFSDSFHQELNLNKGHVEISGTSQNSSTRIIFWADTGTGILHVDYESDMPHTITYSYETWRIPSSHYADTDTVRPEDESILFFHRNHASSVFNDRIRWEEIGHLEDSFPNLERDRTFGGVLKAPGTFPLPMTENCYHDTPCRIYSLQTLAPVSIHRMTLTLHCSQTDSLALWLQQLSRKSCTENICRRKQLSENWWESFWKRSYVHIDPQHHSSNAKDWQAGRNYQLFRYLLACNAYGEFPTKFNGGLFTIDPGVWAPKGGNHTPDDRDWGGLVFTAQNQRLVYWPMLKNGDADMMDPQFHFYQRITEGVKQRTRHFFGLENAACFPEQLDANGLSAYYGRFGLDYPLQVRYHYSTALEFSYMIVEYHLFTGNDISEYMDFICSVISFYEQKYKEKDSDGRRIIFPSTALETYHREPIKNVYGREGALAANYKEEEVAVTNPADVIAALSTTLEALLSTDYGTEEMRFCWQTLLEELPPIPLEIKRGHQVVAPCSDPVAYVKGNVELPQLYTVYPYHIYGIDKPDLTLAQNTYYYCWDEEDQLHYKSWHQMGIFAARCGLRDEAHKYMLLKLSDSGRRFPAFWGPGWDYTPDHNWGGSGMIGVQEMLLQTLDGKIYLLPAWPEELDVEFKLWADHNTCVEVSYQSHTLNYKVSPPEREKDIVICLPFS